MWTFRLSLWGIPALLLLAAIGMKWDFQIADWSRHSGILKASEDFRDLFESFGEPLGIALVALLIWRLDRRNGRQAFRVVAVVAMVAASANLLKVTTGRHRPSSGQHQDLWSGPTWSNVGTKFTSFPSAHTATAFAMACCLSRMYSRGAPVFLLVAACCAAGRIIGVKHFLTDIVAGAAFGWSAAWLCWSILARRRASENGFGLISSDAAPAVSEAA